MLGFIIGEPYLGGFLDGPPRIDPCPSVKVTIPWDKPRGLRCMPSGFMPVVIDLRPSVNSSVQEPNALAQAFQGPQKLDSDTRRVVP